MKHHYVHRYALVGLMIGFGLSGAASAKTIQFTVPIEAQQAFPEPVPLSDASGTAKFTLNLPDNPAEKPTLDFFFQFDGLDLGNMHGFITDRQTPDPLDDVTAVHIHNGAPKSSGPRFLGIVNPRDDFFDVDVDIPNSTISGTWDDDPVTPFSEALDELLAGQLYLNIHTDRNADSDIRAQILIPMPEPATLGLCAVFLALLPFCRRRKARLARRSASS